MLVNISLVLLVVLLWFGFRYFHTSYKVFQTTVLASCAFVDACFSMERARTLGNKDAMPARRLDPMKLHVTYDFSRRLRKEWMKHGVPRSFNIYGLNFKLAKSPFKSIEKISKAQPGVPDYSDVEFHFCGAVDTADLCGLGWPTAKFILEERLTVGTPVNNWYFTLCPHKGVGIRRIDNQKGIA